MIKSVRLRLEEVRQVMRIASDARESRRDPGLQQEVILDGLTCLIGATRSFSITMSNFRPGHLPDVLGAHLGPGIDSTFANWLHQSTRDVSPLDDPMVIAVQPRFERASVTALSEVQPAKAWKRFPVFEHYQREYRIADRLSCCFRHSDDVNTITGFELQRMDSDRDFSAHQMALGQLLLDELRLLHERGELLPAYDPLKGVPPRQREVLKRLLAGKSAKRIAFEMGISVHTVREYLTVLYRRFEVSSREELMAKVLGGNAQA